MNYTEEAERVKQQIAPLLPNGFVEEEQQALAFLDEQDVLKYCLKEAQAIPAFNLPDLNGTSLDFASLIGTADWLVLSFNRGEWCPFCSLELRMLQRYLPQLEAASAKLAVVMPRTPDKLSQLVSTHQFEFPILCDLGLHTAKRFQIVFQLPDYLSPVYRNFGVDEQYINPQGLIELPAPATYIIDRNGIVRKHFVNLDYTKRLDPQEILRFIKAA